MKMFVYLDSNEVLWFCVCLPGELFVCLFVCLLAFVCVCLSVYVYGSLSVCQLVWFIFV